MAYDVERYLNVRSAAGADFGPAGERLSFLTDTTGTMQVWTLDAPAAWPEQRTFYDESVSFAEWSPERDELVFGMDEGGNERTQLYRLAGDGSEVVDLTRHPDAKHGWGGWDSDGDRIAFTSNRRDAATFDVYVQGRDEAGDDARRLLAGDDYGWPVLGGWSPDDERLAVLDMRSNFDLDVHVLDVETGEARQVTDRDDEVRYASLEWAPDGDALYCVTDEGTDTLYLAGIDIDSGAVEPVVEGGEYNVDGVAVHEDTGRLVHSRNVDGYTELTVAELTGAGELAELATPDLPDGVAGGVAWDPDGDRFAVTATGDTHNADVYVVDAETGESVRWTRASTAGIPPGTFDESDLVSFETFDVDESHSSARETESPGGREIPAYFTLPDDAGEGETPVIVDVHGGPESQRRPSFSALKQYFLDRGYAYFEPNVRGSTGYGREYMRLDDVRNRMDAVRDLKFGVEWLRDHPAVDPDRIACKGGSYGGFMVLAALTEYPDLWAAGVDVVGIASFVTFLENTGDWRREHREREYGSLAEDREFLEEISPLNRADRIEAPLFVLHGANDPRVPVGEAEQIAEEVDEQGVPVRKLVFEDEGHGISKLENRIEAYTEIAEFLDEHV